MGDEPETPRAEPPAASDAKPPTPSPGEEPPTAPPPAEEPVAAAEPVASAAEESAAEPLPPSVEESVAAEPVAPPDAKPVASPREPEPQPPSEDVAPTPLQRSRRMWLWAALLLIGAAVLGGVLGSSLGGRQGGPLGAQPAGNGRPTIVVGTVAAAPSVLSIASPSTVPSPVIVAAVTASAAASTEYVVQPGDTLRGIAEREYGDATLWPRIYDANREVIGPDPDNLVAGTKLTVPAR